jgi:hypothetical protein
LSQAADGHTNRRGIGHYGDAQAESAELASLQRFGCSDSLSVLIHQRLHPGTTLIMTDMPLASDTRSGKDFVIVSTEIDLTSLRQGIRHAGDQGRTI